MAAPVLLLKHRITSKKLLIIFHHRLDSYLTVGWDKHQHGYRQNWAL